MDFEIDINDIEEFINNPDFHQYLLMNSKDFGTAAFILQTLLNRVEEIKRLQVDNA